MFTKNWETEIDRAIAPERVRHFLAQLVETPAKDWIQKATPEQCRIVSTLFSGSESLSEKIVSNPQWLEEIFDIDKIKYQRRAQGLTSEITKRLEPFLRAKDYSGALSELRKFKQREMIRVAVRDLAGFAQIDKIVLEISDIADVCLQTVYKVLWQQFIERFGIPYHKVQDAEWCETKFAVIGLGKLGGRELNYSSDVDVIFVYSDEGQVFQGRPGDGLEKMRHLSNHQFFTRFAEAYIAEVSKTTPDGRLFRIDLRLRPEGKAGPLVRSLDSYENYYAQYGQTWERMMLIKARGVAGDEELAHEFIETIQPFRFPRSISDRVLDDISTMKERLENEVVKLGEIESNVKLGRGGIREIEFIVQMLQLTNGGKIPFLQEPNTLACLQKLADYQVLSKDEAVALASAYRFLRKLEHRIQIYQEQQTHTIPVDKGSRIRLASLMGFENLKSFNAELKKHTSSVRKIYNKFFKTKKSKADSQLPQNFDVEPERWKTIFAEHKFRDPDKAYKLFYEFVNGPGYVHISKRTSEVAMHLLEKFLRLCPSKNTVVATEKKSEQWHSFEDGKSGRSDFILSDPDRVLARLDSFISAYGARATLYEMWDAHPSLFELLLLLFDRSEFLAETAIRVPDLVDDLVLSGRLRRTKNTNEILEELRLGINDDDQYLWIRKYHQAERMRIGLRDILGLADYEQCMNELSALADACLQYALEVLMKKYSLEKPPFCIIGMGKLGGQEIDYGSDLDVVFVADSTADDLHKLKTIAAELIDLLSRQTESGMVFKVDARLRPDGEKGLLVNTLSAYEDYYRHRAQLWEIQALTRTRPVAGDLVVGEKYQQIAIKLTNFKEPSLPLVAFKDNWKSEISRMRMRIERERTPKGKEELAIKTGAGGLIDAEFIAQAICLEHGWHIPNTMSALKFAKEKKVLPEEDIDKLIDNYARLRRIEGILRRWSYEGEVLLPDDPAPYYRVSVRCGFPTPDDFRKAVAEYRKSIREVYNKYFSIN